MQAKNDSDKKSRRLKIILLNIKRNKLYFVLLIFASTLLIYALFLRPLIGLADNGDFYRIMQSSNLYYLNENFEDKHFSFFNKLYGIKQYFNEIDSESEFITTHLIPIKVAIFINELLFSRKVFDIRVLGFLYSILFLVAILMIVKFAYLKTKIRRVALAASLVIIFLDMGYIAYFNSFYGEAASLIFLLLTIGSFFYFANSGNFTIPKFLIFVIFTVMFIGAKQQNIPLVVLFIILLIRTYFLRPDVKWKVTIALSMLIMLATSAIIYFSVSGEIENINKYHAITLGVIKDSPNPGNDLKEIGIDPKFAILAGTTYYERYPLIQPDSKIMKEEFYDHYSFFKIIFFYLKHFDRFIDKLNITAKNVFMVKQPELGNFKKSENLPAGKVTNFYSVWSNFKEAKMPRSLSFLIIFYGTFLISLIIKYFKNWQNNRVRMNIEMLIIIAAIGSVQFLVSLIGAGEADLSKHLFLFDVCFDMIVVALIVNVVGHIGKVLRNKN